MTVCSTSTLMMRFCHSRESLGNTERNQNVPRSFLNSRVSIGISDFAPFAARASAAGSDRLSARAKSQNDENTADDCDLCGAPTLCTGATGIDVVTPVGGRCAIPGASERSEPMRSISDEAMTGTRVLVSAVQSISSGGWFPVYSANIVVTPHGRGAGSALA